MKIGCLGPSGSYSEQAAKELTKDARLILYKNFPAVVRSLTAGETDGIVLPLENTLQGGVLQNMDLLAEEENLFAVEEYLLPIDHRLVKKKGVPLSKLQRVFSHAQALGQCSVFLSEELPWAKTVQTDSTAEGFSRMQEDTDACIVSLSMTKELGEEYDVSAETVADEKKNFTSFKLIQTGIERLNKPSKFIYFVAELPHVSGSLYSLLGVIDEFDLNMTKIESRPIKTKVGEYRFFIEFEGDYQTQKVQTALEKIREKCSSFRLLGAY